MTDNMIRLGGTRRVPRGTQALRLNVGTTWTFDEVTILMGTDNSDFVMIDAPKVGRTVVMAAMLFPVTSKAALEHVIAQREVARLNLMKMEAALYSVERFPC